MDDTAARYGRPVFVAETACSPTRSPSARTPRRRTRSTPAANWSPATRLPGHRGRPAWMNVVANIVETVPNGRGLGVFCWEATLDRRHRQRLWTRPTPRPETAGRTRPCSATTARHSPPCAVQPPLNHH
ncbi:glycosyl hydrolase 53 family protein [Streptomyces sp. NPDC048279]|uniref:glycosyl hydrolase 53 family protein n=1 Tax=Streptomyces sp. NPDC048279 TaxID=3154714 RepID=UPI00341FDF1D